MNLKAWMTVGLLTLASGTVWADAASKQFGKLRDKAKPAESLAQFLTDFIGDCGSDPLNGKQCQAKVEANRKASLGQVFILNLDDSQISKVKLKTFNPRTHEFEFQLTPVFDATGYALTEGQPAETDGEGHLVIPNINMKSVLPDSTTPMDIEAVFKTGQIRIQLIFKPEGVWKVARKDKAGSFYEGVKSRILAVRVSHTRTGNEVVSLVVPEK